MLDRRERVPSPETGGPGGLQSHVYTAKDAKSAKEMPARGIFQGFLLGALGVLGGSFCFLATLQSS